MINISICICTRNRQEGLKRLLHSIENLETPPKTNVRIIVVENNSKNHSENIIKEFSSKSKFKISYFLETSQGLSFARNRSVKEANDCDFCCFVDDDQIVASNWLVELFKCQIEFNADGIWGPNPPLFDYNVPSYVIDFHKPDFYKYGTIVKKAHTNCLLLRKEYLDIIDGPFDVRLNFTGGEDSHLTSLITRAGGIIRFNPYAIAYEIIPENRTTINYMINRTFRIANAGLLIRSLSEKNFSKLDALPRLIIRFCYGSLIFIPFLLFSKTDKLKGLIKIANAAGGLSFILGKRNNFYR